MIVFIGFDDDMNVVEITECTPTRIEVMDMIVKSHHTVCVVVDVEEEQIDTWIDSDCSTLGDDLADLDMCGMVIAKIDNRKF
ncbi:hypothetical protein [Aeromonas phage AS-yj]|uniref:Uncharacterized protein n=1 Tax=Aeromonas phage AS-yj TaxID=2026115 RepID=A0A291LEF7_9CAUD|nr:hypothetical protein [Aeromonas phage AS-yj]QMV28856.1 hypothetical protein AP1_0149 [Aeromonas phage AP1]